MKRILVIEDDPVILKNTADFLNEEGFEVFTAEDGVQGIQVALDIIPDMIISDISMPKKDGYEVCKTLQSVPSTCTIPFIFLTARGQKDDLRIGMQSGADDYLTKPFDYSELLMCIKLRLEKHERFIRQSDERFFALIDNPIVGVYIYVDNKFLFSNALISEITGYSKGELKQMSFEDLVYTEDNDTSLEKIQRCLSGIQSNVHTELKIFRKDKSQVGIGVFGTLIKFRKKECLMGNILGVKSDSISEMNAEKNIEKSKLSQREIDVLRYICQGFSSGEISEKLFLSQNTIETHRAKLIAKTGSRNTADLVMYAVRNALVEL